MFKPVIKPKIYAIAGGPGAGKTTFVQKARQNGKLPPGIFVHDCDAVMNEMPEYREYLTQHGPVEAFKNFELTARRIAEEELGQQIAHKADVIYDRSCALQESYDFLTKLVQEDGYNLILYVLYVEPNIAIERAKSREQETQRHTPEKVIIDRTQMISSRWTDYLRIAHEVYLIDSSTTEYQVLAQYKDSQLTVFNQDHYDHFIKTGKTTTSVKASIA